MNLLDTLVNRRFRSTLTTKSFDNPRRVFGLTSLWMDATTGFTDRRNDPVYIRPLLLPVCCPRFLKGAGLLSRGETEPTK